MRDIISFIHFRLGLVLCQWMRLAIVTRPYLHIFAPSLSLTFISSDRFHHKNLVRMPFSEVQLFNRLEAPVAVGLRDLVLLVRRLLIS